MLTAAFVIGDQPRFITRAHLTHFDAATELTREVFREVAEINALIAEIEHQQQRLIKREFEINDLRGESRIRRHLAHARQCSTRLVVACGGAIEIFHGR